MKKLTLSVLALSVVSVAQEPNVTWFFGAGQGKSDISYEIGMRWNNMGANIYSAGNYDYGSNEVEPIEPPHTQYKRYDNQKVGKATGIELMGFLPIKFALPFIEGGINVQEYRDVAVSTNINDTGVVYTLNRRHKFNFSYGAGIMFFHKGFTIGGGYNNVKGIMGYIGYTF